MHQQGTLTNLSQPFILEQMRYILLENNFGLRAFAGNFSDEEIVKAMDFLHAHGKKGYVTLNIVAKDSDFQNINPYLQLLVDAKS